MDQSSIEIRRLASVKLSRVLGGPAVSDIPTARLVRVFLRWDMTQKYLKLEDVVELTGCSPRHIREEVKRKNLRAFKPGKMLLFDPVDVEKWIKRKAA